MPKIGERRVPFLRAQQRYIVQLAAVMSAVAVVGVVGFATSAQAVNADSAIVDERDGCGRALAALAAEQPGRDGAPRDRVTFALKFGDEISPHGLITVPVMPGRELEIEAVLTDHKGVFRATADGGSIAVQGPEKWTWRAPDTPGLHCITVTDENANESICLQAAVMRPYAGEEVLNGYQIGSYQALPLRGEAAYRRPAGFIEVTAANADAWVSPHFRLRQFLCKQESAYPKYLALSTRLLLKLEMLVHEMKSAGIDLSTFTVMSAYRTPYYNASIGNRTIYTRHAYGDAADIFIDRDGSGRMDDIDGSGTVDRADAQAMATVVEGLANHPWYRPFVGGLGIYGPAPHRGPFIHVDTRGRRARW